MNPFDKLKEKKDKSNTDKAKLQLEIKELSENRKALETELNAAAAGDDIDEYLRIKNEIGRLDASAEMKSYKLNHAQELSVDDVMATWSEYRKQYDKDFATAYAAMKKEKEKFLAAVRNLLIVQNTGLRERNRVGALLGWVPGINHATVNGAVVSFTLADKLPMKTIETKNLIDGNQVSFRGHVTVSEIAIYLNAYPESAADTVLNGYPVDESKL